jgi:DNA-directed RNA polymerase specialized sigma subunit|tara:strand:- start:1733 stop:2074 length:342 start_codon:yes stop_codon:yes gene_type:complete
VTNKHYINNKEFEKLIILYKQDPKEHEDELFGMFDMLISNIITGFSFKVDEDDAKQECFLLILKTLKNFNPEMGNAFNYFTTIILNNLKLMYTKNKKYAEKIDIYTELRKDLL